MVKSLFSSGINVLKSRCLEFFLNQPFKPRKITDQQSDILLGTCRQALVKFLIKL